MPFGSASLRARTLRASATARGASCFDSETRALAQEWTYRFLGAAVAHHHEDDHGLERYDALPAAGDVPSAEPTTAEVRRWAMANGHDVSDRGRLRPEVWSAYRTAHDR